MSRRAKEAFKTALAMTLAYGIALSQGWDNKYLLFQAFLDQVIAEAAAEVQARWIDQLAGVDVFVDSHVRTALIYVRWDD